MTARIGIDQLGTITATALTVWQDLARPCTCPNERCATIGQHIHTATRNASCGIRAASSPCVRAPDGRSRVS